MDTTTPKLKQHNIRRRQIKNCQCSQTAFIYTIPIKLDEKIVKCLTHMGRPAFDFKATSILKIETPDFAITGVRRLREIRFTLKKQVKGSLDIFEDAVIKYLEVSKEK